MGQLLQGNGPRGVTRSRRQGRSRTNSASWAAGTGRIEALTVLLEARDKVDPCRKDKLGRTPLSWAAGNGHDEAVKLLLRSCFDASPDEPDHNRRTPLWWASERRRANTVSVLLERGAALDEEDYHHETPLMRAARRNHEGVMRLLVQHGLRRYQHDTKSVEARGVPQLPWASKYLHMAAKAGWSGLAKMLIDEGIGADSYVTSTTNGHSSTSPLDAAKTETPLRSAARMGHLQIVELLLQAGANVNFETPGGKDTPLLLALQNGREDVAKALLEAGADAQKSNASVKTARDLAVEFTLSSVCTILDKKSEDGRFDDELRPENNPVDLLFSATVVDFSGHPGAFETKATEIPVAELLRDLSTSGHQSELKPSFRCYHLPANNVGAH